LKTIPTPAFRLRQDYAGQDGHPPKGGAQNQIPSRPACREGQGRIGISIAVMVLWCLAFALACRLLNRPELQKHAGAGLIAEVLGETRLEVSELFFEQADLVFHRGAGHFHRQVLDDWFTRMRKEVAPSGHFHLHNRGVLEIMPWLYFAAHADPRNVTAYTVAAFWLAGEAGRPDLAEGVLDEALRNNPGDYRVYMEKGNLAVREGKYAEASRFFNAAQVLFRKTTGGDKEQLRIDLAEILTYRGLLYELEGDPARAARNYREVTDMFPGRLRLKERMLELEKKLHAATPPEELLDAILLQRRVMCAENEDVKREE